MHIIKHILFPMMLGVAVVSCGVSQRSVTMNEGRSETGSNSPEGRPSAMNVSTIDETKASLMDAYQDWQGTPYRLGGESRNGVDCSMFVNIVFENYFDIGLPTNTRTQLNVGNGVRRSAIRTGDLVFFRTGRKTLHVGVAVNQYEFLHASTSNGVTISELGQEYWADRYLAARRVL